MPPLYAEGMYDRTVQARSLGGKFTIGEPPASTQNDSASAENDSSAGFDSRLGHCAIIGLAAVAWVLIGLQPKPLLVNKAGFSQAVYDREGHLLRLTLSSDEKYRLWVPLSEIPPTMIDATLLQEDAWFRWHSG